MTPHAQQLAEAGAAERAMQQQLLRSPTGLHPWAGPCCRRVLCQPHTAAPAHRADRPAGQGWREAGRGREQAGMGRRHGSWLAGHGAAARLQPTKQQKMPCHQSPLLLMPGTRRGAPRGMQGATRAGRPRHASSPHVLLQLGALLGLPALLRVALVHLVVPHVAGLHGAEGERPGLWLMPCCRTGALAFAGALAGWSAERRRRQEKDLRWQALPWLLPARLAGAASRGAGLVAQQRVHRPLGAQQVAPAAQSSRWQGQACWARCAD